ncbi:MAG TPA: 3-deoxy-D-manno-octulosonic acid transferase [Candidatus Obscuribacter sp.]|nr:3-deoxy-D-manno-octulosonic acid transferase [Candidatus Obscuribacter sp.]HNA72287.1 3-deoxy-D-manno-octulosonic acid transferase [Candidatus Obscuribacter sp.]HND06871.1 3-deoxy-D-manno-octulosonic acid transferase [Candidatus Obscuribacter sp.]HND69516.1 3-deoxy-D-manno-octulosonic acid transferase [Candidatus Obscuribacter sp.]HNG74095.1 3-deoxy-D-manno-octulosonic acid transferase [Candidatus Obscuribacter sp.]
MGISSSDLKKVSRKVSKKHGSVSGGATAVTFSYYFCFALLLLLALPLLLFKKKARAGFSEKLGIIPGRIKSKQRQLAGCLWFHAVSVGEFNAVFPLIKAFKKEHPAAGLVVSTTTGTGQALAREKCRDLAEVIYFPYDLPFSNKAWLDALSPSLVAITETEIWPGFTYECKKRGIMLTVVNGRISPRSFKGYKRFRAFFGPVLRRFDNIGVQSLEEAERYRAIAGQEAKITVLGNLKFDGLTPPSEETRAALRALVNIDAGAAPVVVAGSTHEGEEAAFLSYLKEHGKKREFHLILVPRHPERFQHVARLIEEAGFVVRRYSKQEGFLPDLAVSKQVYLLDAIGKLFDFYSLADIAFVGGTLAPIGGHNIMEPYAYGVPVVVGPHIEKTRDVAQALSQAGALTMVSSGEALTPALSLLLSDESERLSRGERGRGILIASQGAVGKAMHMLEATLSKNNPSHELSGLN